MEGPEAGAEMGLSRRLVKRRAVEKGGGDLHPLPQELRGGGTQETEGPLELGVRLPMAISLLTAMVGRMPLGIFAQGLPLRAVGVISCSFRSLP